MFLHMSTAEVARACSSSLVGPDTSNPVPRNITWHRKSSAMRELRRRAAAARASATGSPPLQPFFYPTALGNGILGEHITEKRRPSYASNSEWEGANTQFAAYVQATDPPPSLEEEADTDDEDDEAIAITINSPNTKTLFGVSAPVSFFPMFLENL